MGSVGGHGVLQALDENSSAVVRPCCDGREGSKLRRMGTRQNDRPTRKCCVEIRERPCTDKSWFGIRAMRYGARPALLPEMLTLSKRLALVARLGSTISVQ